MENPNSVFNDWTKSYNGAPRDELDILLEEAFDDKHGDTVYLLPKGERLGQIKESAKLRQKEEPKEGTWDGAADSEKAADAAAKSEPVKATPTNTTAAKPATNTTKTTTTTNNTDKAFALERKTWLSGPSGTGGSNVVSPDASMWEPEDQNLFKFN